MKKRLCWTLSLLLLIGGSGASFAQSTNSGDIRGTVTDSSGALLPDVSVAVTNKDTGVTKNLTTNHDGLYDTSSIVVGTYEVTFSKNGFAPFKRSTVTVQVGVMTVNAVMKLGSVAQEVVVNTDAPLLQTESGEQSTTLAAKEMAQLPNVGQDWENFSYILPGTSNLGSWYSGQTVSANGNLPYSNILADGASTTLSHSQNANPANFESIAELQVTTSAFSAQYGIGGIIINQITKGGTSSFHGTAYDYIQNDAFNAPYYGFGNPQTVPFLRYHNFGGSIGGPVWKMKNMFFYFNYDQTLNHGVGGNYSTTVPTADVMAGNFTGQPLIYDPTTQVMAKDAAGNPYPVRKSFQSEYGSNSIPTAMFDKVAAGVQQFYPTPSNHIPGGIFIPGTLSNGIDTFNFRSTFPVSAPIKKYFGRLDYDVTPHNRITMSNTQSDAAAPQPSNISACPIGCGKYDIPNDNAQVTDVWTINDHTINEARMGYTWQGNFFSDEALNQGYASKLGWQFAKADEYPGIVFNNYSSPYQGISPGTNATQKEHTFDPSDVVTMIRGKHVLHLGGEFLFYRDNSTAWGNVNAGSLNFSGQYTQHWTVDPKTGLASPDTSTGLVYADFLLGAAQSWSANVSPEYGARLKSPQVFIQDDYKVRPNLTLNLGLRYQITHGWNEVHGNMATFDPTVANPGTGTLGGMWYGTTHANGRTSLQASVYNTFLPRIGFSWQPHQDMTLRGGFGVYAYNLSLDTYGSNAVGAAMGSSGNTSDQTNGITPLVYLAGNGNQVATGLPLPFVTAPTTPDAFNGSGVTYYQYHTPTPEIYQWNLAVQHELGTNMVGELAYVASHGFNLNFPTDLNQVPLAYLSSNDAAHRPYPGFQSINGSTNNAISNYNSLQASITRRLSLGLSFNFNYVWSHFLDDQDSSGWGGRGGLQNFQIANNPAANYGNSNFDIRNAFKGNVVYELPFGKNRMFLNNNWLADEVVGGWQLSGTMVLSTGLPFTVYAGDANSFAQAGSVYANRVPGVSATPAGGRTINEWFNPAAFSRPANGTFGNAGRNSMYGPGTEVVNLTAGKKFTIWEQVKLQIRADATNAFNHPNFVAPNSYLTSPNPGTTTYAGAATNVPYINGTTNSRNMQLGVRLEF